MVGVAGIAAGLAIHLQRQPDEYSTGVGEQRLVVLEDGTEYAHPGKLLFSDLTVDSTSGQVTLRAELPNPGGRLLPGQFVRAQIVTGEQDAFLVPQAAVQSGDAGRFVWVMGADGKAAPKPVQAGPWLGADWVIRSGLAAGEQVAADPQAAVRATRAAP